MINGRRSNRLKKSVEFAKFADEIESEGDVESVVIVVAGGLTKGLNCKICG